MERSLRDKGGKVQGCAWVTAACSARAVTLCGRWLQAQPVRLPGHLLFAGKQVSRGHRPARPGRREAPDSSGRPAFRLEHGASARSTTPFCASRILGAQIWNPREEGVRPAPRALSLSWCPWQTPCLRLALPPRLSPEQDDCGHLRPGREQRAAVGLGRAEGERPQRAAPPWSPLCGCPSSSPGARGAASRGSDSPVVNQAPRKAL